MKIHTFWKRLLIISAALAVWLSLSGFSLANDPPPPVPYYYPADPATGTCIYDPATKSLHCGSAPFVYYQAYANAANFYYLQGQTTPYTYAYGGAYPYYDPNAAYAGYYAYPIYPYPYSPSYYGNYYPYSSSSWSSYWQAVWRAKLVGKDGLFIDSERMGRGWRFRYIP